MNKIIQILNNHKWAIILALLAAVIIAYPQVYMKRDLGSLYQGIDLMGASDDESTWMSRVREVQDGYPTMSCVYFKDGKNAPYIIQPLGSIIVANLGKIFALDLNNTILFSRFFFSFLVFLILYAFILLCIKEKFIALATPTVLFLAGSLFGRHEIFQMLAGQSPSTSFLSLTRPVNPALTWFFFFGFLLFFWLFYERKQWRWGILSILFLSSSFYDYFYTWTFLYSFLGVLCLIFLFQKKWSDIKRIVLVILGASFIAIPWFINLYQATTYASSWVIGAKAGLLEGRVPVLGFLVPALFIIFLLCFPRQCKERYYFFLSLVIAPFIVLNEQLITGKALMSAHYHWYFHKPLAIIFLLMIFFSWVSGAKRGLLKKTSAILIIAASIYTGIFIQNSSYHTNKEGIIKNQRYGQVMDWLDKNAKKDEVVFSNEELVSPIVIYTPLNIFYHSSAGACLVTSQERLLNDFFLYYRLNGVGKDQAQEVFFRDRVEISHLFFGLHYRETTGDYADIPDEAILEFVQKYQDSFTISTADFFNNLLTKYEVKYLVWDKESDPQWPPDQYSFFKKIAEFGDFVIYEKL